MRHVTHRNPKFFCNLLGRGDDRSAMAKVHKGLFANDGYSDYPNILSVLPKARAALPPVDFVLLSRPAAPVTVGQRPPSRPATSQGSPRSLRTRPVTPRNGAMDSPRARPVTPRAGAIDDDVIRRRTLYTLKNAGPLMCDTSWWRPGMPDFEAEGLGGRLGPEFEV